MGRRSKYSSEFRHDAVELVRNSEDSMRRIAADLGVSQETLRGWVNQDRIDRGEGKPGELTVTDRSSVIHIVIGDVIHSMIGRVIQSVIGRSDPVRDRMV